MHHLFFSTSPPPQHDVITPNKGSPSEISIKLSPTFLIKCVSGKKVYQCCRLPVVVNGRANVLFRETAQKGDRRNTIVNLHLDDSLPWLIKLIDFVKHTTLEIMYRSTRGNVHCVGKTDGIKYKIKVMLNALGATQIGIGGRLRNGKIL
jgi:hypothetical protein